MFRPIIILFLLFNVALSAQEIDFKPKIDFFQLPNFELNTDEITDIQTDEDGYVWIISLTSIHKYDGSNFQKINTNKVNHGSFIRFQQSANGTKYVIDYLNNIFIIKNNKLSSYKYNDILRKAKHSALFSSFKFDQKGNLHIANPPVSHFTIKNGSLNDMSKHYENYRGHGVKFINKVPFAFYNGTIGGRTTRFFKIFDEEYKVVDSIAIIHNGYSEYHSIVKKADDNYLYSTGVGSIIEFNQKQIIAQYDYSDQLIRLFVDQSGGLWASTKNDGIHYYKNSNIDSSNLTKYFKNTLAFASTQDYQGGIWLFSSENGLGYISNPYLDFNSENDIIIDLNKDSLYYASKNGIWAYSEKSQESSLIWKTNFYSEFISIFKDTLQNRLFVSSAKDAVYIKNNKINHIEFKGFNNMKGTGMLNFIMPDPSRPNDIYGITKYQFFKYDHRDSIIDESPHFPTIISKFLKQEDSIWTICTNGIYFTKEDSNITYLGKEFPIAQNYASDLILFNNTKYFSFPNNGIFTFKGNHFNEIKYHGSSLLDCRLVVENDSVLWALSSDGCFRIRKAEKDSTHRIDAFQAFPRLTINQIKGNKKYIYLTTNNGHLARSSFQNLRKQELQIPKLLISEVETKDSIYKYPINNTIKLPFENRSIQFNFESLDFKNLNLLFRYKLSGEQVEDAWHTTKAKLVNYASLSPGQYTFQVQSKFRYGNWSKAQSVSFVIATPFWQESWFIVGVVLLSIILISQIIAYRYKVIFKEQRLKLSRLQSEQNALRALMTPHYFFNFVSSLQYLILDETREKASRFLELFSSSMRNILHQSDTNYISIQKELKFIEEYLEMERFRMDGLFEYQIHHSPDIDLSEAIPPFMIQPFIENAIEHGISNIESTGLIKVNFENQDNFLKVTIADNGVGRSHNNEKKKGKSYGVSLIEKRLVIHNQSEKGVEIIDLFDEQQKPSGTVVVVHIKRVKIKK